MMSVRERAAATVVHTVALGSGARSCSGGYKNMWGSNAPKSLQTQHKSPTIKGDLAQVQGEWKLDWEEVSAIISAQCALWARFAKEEPCIATPIRNNIPASDRSPLWAWRCMILPMP